MDEQINPVANDNTIAPDQLSDVLLLLDDEKKKIRIVKGIGKDGEPETVEPDNKNSNQFLKVDRHGDVFTNFFANLVSQIKNPSRFRFFKVPEKLAITIANYLQKHVENPIAIGETLMKQYEVSKEKMDNSKNLIQSNMETNQETKTEQPVTNTAQVENKIPNTPAAAQQSEGRAERASKFNVDSVDWTLLNKLGLDRNKLEKMNVLDPLLRGFKSNKLLNVSFNLEGVPMRFDARISFQVNQNNQVVPAFHGIQRAPNLDFPFLGHNFSEEDKKNLLTDGNMGRAVELTNPRTGEIVPSLISIDRLTNEIVAIPKEWVKIPDEVSNIKLTAQQKEDLTNGKQLHLTGMVSQKGNPFEARIQYNAEKRFLEYLFDDKPKLSVDNITQKEPKEAPRVYRNKELTDKQYERFKSGQTMLITDFKDDAGKKYSGYITYDREKGVTAFSFEDPRKIQSQATTAEGNKTQKAVNSDGKTNEATKKIQGPLDQNQITPNTQQQQQRMQPPKPVKSQGRKM